MTQDQEREPYSGPRDIVSLLSEASRRVGFIPKAQANSDGGPGFRFRGIDQVMGATHTVFNELGIVVVPTVLKDKRRYSTRTNRNGQEIEWERVSLRVRFDFRATGDAGEYQVLSATVVGSGLDNSDKASNKALSQALKYALLQVLNVPTSDMEESDRSSPQVAGSRRPTGPAQPASNTWGSVWSFFTGVGFTPAKSLPNLKAMEWTDGTRVDADLARALALRDLAQDVDWDAMTNADDAFEKIFELMELVENAGSPAPVAGEPDA